MTQKPLRELTFTMLVPNNAADIAEAFRAARIRHPRDPYDRQQDIPRTARIKWNMVWDCGPMEAMRLAMAGMITLPDKMEITFVWTTVDEEMELAYAPEQLAGG